MSYNYKVLFIDEIINHIKKYGYADTPSVAIYYQIYSALIEGEKEEHYYKLKILLDKHSKDFPLEEASSMYTYAMNYCTRKINRGSPKFLEEYFDLYVDLLHKEFLLDERGELAPWHLKNIVTVALRLGKFEWTENFINNYQSYLSPNYRENAVTYNLATVYFYQKKYSDVIKLLQTVEYEDVAYNLGSKTMLLATYYETEELDALDALLESFRAFLNRHKGIPEIRRSEHKNLIRFTKKLTRLISSDKKAIQKLKEEIASTKNIASKKWLKEKIAALE